MKELTKLSPELEGNISKYEQMVFVVPNDKTREDVIVVLKEIKTIRANVVAFFKPQKDAINKAKEELMKIINPLLNRCDAIEKNAKGAIIIYDAEQENIRKVEQARLQAIEDARVRKERERLLKRAEKLKTPEKAEAALEEAANIIAPVIQVAEPEKNKGEVKKKTWKARVVNIDDLDKQYMIPNDKMLDGIAKSTKGNVKIKGVEFYQESSLAIAI